MEEGCLLAHTPLTFLLYTAQLTHLGIVLPTVAWTLLIYQDSLNKAILQPRFPSFQVIVLCQIDYKNQQGQGE